MDVFGLVLAIPAVLAANSCYVLGARFVLSRFRRREWLVWPSAFVLGLLVIDLILIITIGAVASRTLIGHTFWGMHLTAVVLGAPALANVLVLRRGGAWFRHWHRTIALCCVFGVFLVFFQVAVGEALFGPDGTSGPFEP